MSNAAESGDSDESEYMLLTPDADTISAFIRSLETRGIRVDLAVVEMPSEASSGTLSVEFWHENATTEGTDE